jgi:xanthine dehydrogenase small subunit
VGHKQFRELRRAWCRSARSAISSVSSRTAADGTLTIGAGASLEAAWQALAARVPALTDVYLRFASPPIRNAGTMGGNVANGSPIGDSAPILMALDASLVLRKGSRVRTMPLADFYVDYMKNRLEPANSCRRSSCHRCPPRARCARTRSASASTATSRRCAPASRSSSTATSSSAVRLAYGGMAGIVKRATGAEAAIVGQPWTQAAVQRAQAALATDFKPLTDMRASAEYRAQVAQNLLQRFWLETRPRLPCPPRRPPAWSTMTHTVGA